MNLQEAIKNKQPIDVYLKNDFYDIFYFNQEKNIYQGQFGYLDMDTITKVMLNKEEVNHIKIKVHNANDR